MLAAEQYNWAVTRGVNEEMLLQNLPEDLQRDIRRHLFKFVKKVRLSASYYKYKPNSFYCLLSCSLFLLHKVDG